MSERRQFDAGIQAFYFLKQVVATNPEATAVEILRLVVRAAEAAAIAEQCAEGGCPVEGP